MAQALPEDPQIAAATQAENMAYDMILGDGAKVFDLSQEKPELRDRYGKSKFGQSCLVARRLVERGIPYVTINYAGWDTHKGNFQTMQRQLPELDKGFATLLQDLSERGLLDSTIVWWGGEFGRTPMNEARGGSPFLGRDHHPHCFTMWMAGGGVKGGLQYGSTDEIGYRVAENKVGVRDLQSTILHLVGLDPYHLSYKFQGLNNRLIGPSNEGRVIKEILS